MADIFDEAILRARRASRRRTPPPPPPLTVRTEDGQRLNEGQLWLASLWFVLTVALLPEAIWPLLLSPVLLGLAVFTVRAWMARRTADEKSADGTVMEPGEAVLFGALASLMVGGLWIGGRGALFLLPIVAGALFVSGRLLPGTWERLREQSRQPARAQGTTDPAVLLPEEAAATLAGSGSAAERSATLHALCRASVRYTLEDASRALRSALTGRPRVEDELLSELSGRYGDAVTRVVINTAINKRAVRRYGRHLALAMDGAYRAA